MTDEELERLVAARRDGRGMVTYPGQLPATLDGAYAVQRRANAVWGAAIVGWKVGRINPPLDLLHGANRFMGAVFAGTIVESRDGEVMAFPVIRDGFGAFEAELVMVLDSHPNPAHRDWDTEAARALVAALHIGVEVAGSPIADIQAHGPIGSIAAFGNAIGMILGPPIADWRAIDIDAIACTTRIDSVEIASRTAGSLPGGPFAALAFALNTAATLGQPLRAGDHVLTGAITGVHAVQIGQRCSADFGNYGRIDCVTVAAA